MKAARLHAGALASRVAVCAAAVLLCGCTRAPAGAARAAPVPRAVPHAGPAAPVPLAGPSAPAAAAAAPAAAAASVAPAANPFGAISWLPAPAPAAPAQAAAPVSPSVPVSVTAPVPVAPPLPFRFLGRYGDGQVQSVMLAKGERLYLATIGDTIDGVYRIDALTAQSVELTYLPLQLKQSLGTGDAG
jgi:hypothetical protein